MSSPCKSTCLYNPPGLHTVDFSLLTDVHFHSLIFMQVQRVDAYELDDSDTDWVADFAPLGPLCGLVLGLYSSRN